MILVGVEGGVGEGGGAGGDLNDAIGSEGGEEVAGVLGGEDVEGADRVEEGGVEEGELGMGGEGLCEGEGGGDFWGESDEGPEGGDEVALEGGEGGVGVAGEGGDAGPAGEGFAWALGDAVEEGWADEGFEGGANVVFFALGDAAGEDDEVALLAGLGDAGGGCFEVVGQVGEGDLGGAPGFDGGFEGEAIGAPELMGERGVLGREEFVAGGEDGDAGEAGDGEGGGSDGGGKAELERAEEGAGGEEEVALGGVTALAVDEFSGLDFAVDLGVGVGEGEFLVGDDGIAVRREDGTGHDLPAGAGGEWSGGGGAGGVESVEGEIFFTGVPEGDAVHGDAIEGREGAVGVEGFAEDAVEGFGEGNGLRREGRDRGEDEGFRFGR